MKRFNEKREQERFQTDQNILNLYQFYVINVKRAFESFANRHTSVDVKLVNKDAKKAIILVKLENTIRQAIMVFDVIINVKSKKMDGTFNISTDLKMRQASGLWFPLSKIKKEYGPFEFSKNTLHEGYVIDRLIPPTKYFIYLIDASWWQAGIMNTLLSSIEKLIAWFEKNF